jgi:alkylresorcinol/alkylpyrone synthase
VSHLVGLASALPGAALPQELVTDTLAPVLATDPARDALLRRVHASAGVRTRHLALPVESYADLGSFGATNDAFLEHGAALATEALGKALADAGLEPRDVDYLLVTSVTGIGAPGLDAVLVDRLGLRPDVRRLPSFGLGCAGGAAGLARVHEYLDGHPEDVAALVCVELCSLTLQRDDVSAANLVATGLFGDGAAAAVLVGREHRAAGGSMRPQIVDARGELVPGTADELGWRVCETGLRIVLSGALPEIVARSVPGVVDRLLAPHGLAREDVASWVVHAGGPKVIDAVRDSLELPEAAVATSRASLAAVGNLSSASVLHVLGLHEPGAPGWGVMIAFGPGVACELVLLRWPEV